MEVKRLLAAVGRWLRNQWWWLVVITVGVSAATAGFVVAPIPLWLIVVAAVIAAATGVVTARAVLAGDHRARVAIAAFSVIAIAMVVCGSVVGEAVR